MVDPGRRHRRLAPLALGLALWSGLPSFEWCPFTWEECWKACEAAVAEPACDPAGSTSATAEPVCASACPPIAASACAPSGVCTTRSALRLLPCGPEADPVPFGDRAWCIHAPIEGVPARGVELPPVDTGCFVLVVDAPRLPLPARAARERLEVASACPALHAPHAPPQSRAPPPA